MLTILFALAFATAAAAQECVFHLSPPTGCDVDGPDPKVRNCMLVENHTDMFAEIGIDGVCPVGSGLAAFQGGPPAYIDFTPADPTTGARPVMPPRSKAWYFHTAATMRGTLRAMLYTQSADFPVMDAQFVPAVTFIAPPMEKGPVPWKRFAAAYSMYSRGANWGRIRS